VRGMDFTILVSGRAVDLRDMRAQHYFSLWAFPLYRPMDEKRSLSSASTKLSTQA